MTALSGHQKDPYHGYRFKVEIRLPVAGANYVQYGFQKVTGLGDESEVVDYREGDEDGTVRKLPGLNINPEVVLENGIGPANGFIEEWRAAVRKSRAEGGLLKSDIRGTVRFTLMNNDGERVRVWEIKNAWPSKYETGDLDAQASDVLIQKLTLQHEGFKRSRPSETESGINYA